MASEASASETPCCHRRCCRRSRTGVALHGGSFPLCAGHAGYSLTEPVVNDIGSPYVRPHGTPRRPIPRHRARPSRAHRPAGPAPRGRGAARPRLRRLAQKGAPGRARHRRRGAGRDGDGPHRPRLPARGRGVPHAHEDEGLRARRGVGARRRLRQAPARGGVVPPRHGGEGARLDGLARRRGGPSRDAPGGGRRCAARHRGAGAARGRSPGPGKAPTHR